jgi:Na+/glutamate symporter
VNSGWFGLIGAVVGLLGALVVSWLNNRANTKRQERQLQHDAERQERQLRNDAEQRRLERDRSLQREIYLGAIEAMGKWQWYLGRMADMNLPDEKFPDFDNLKWPTLII